MFKSLYALLAFRTYIHQVYTYTYTYLTSQTSARRNCWVVCKRRRFAVWTLHWKYIEVRTSFPVLRRPLASISSSAAESGRLRVFRMAYGAVRLTLTHPHPLLLPLNTVLTYSAPDSVSFLTRSYRLTTYVVLYLIYVCMCVFVHVRIL
jgi:hypothetical protein